MKMTPIKELIELDKEYTCDRALFGFVNRNLNELGLQAYIFMMSEDDISFRVIEAPKPS
jgi:hypothetical protein